MLRTHLYTAAYTVFSTLLIGALCTVMLSNVIWTVAELQTVHGWCIITMMLALTALHLTYTLHEGKSVGQWLGALWRLARKPSGLLLPF